MPETQLRFKQQIKSIARFPTAHTYKETNMFRVPDENVRSYSQRA